MRRTPLATATTVTIPTAKPVTGRFAGVVTDTRPCPAVLVWQLAHSGLGSLRCWCGAFWSMPAWQSAHCMEPCTPCANAAVSCAGTSRFAPSPSAPCTGD